MLMPSRKGVCCVHMTLVCCITEDCRPQLDCTWSVLVLLIGIDTVVMYNYLCSTVLHRDGMIKRAMYDRSLQKTLQLNQEKYASMLDWHTFNKHDSEDIEHQEESVEDLEPRKRTMFSVGLSDQ